MCYGLLNYWIRYQFRISPEMLAIIFFGFQNWILMREISNSFSVNFLSPDKDVKLIVLLKRNYAELGFFHTK